jgi:hypothetical protein
VDRHVPALGQKERQGLGVQGSRHGAASSRAVVRRVVLSAS